MTAPASLLVTDIPDCNIKMVTKRSQHYAKTVKDPFFMDWKKLDFIVALVSNKWRREAAGSFETLVMNHLHDYIQSWTKWHNLHLGCHKNLETIQVSDLSDNVVIWSFVIAVHILTFRPANFYHFWFTCIFMKPFILTFRLRLLTCHNSE
jgi:hypothetical protein